MQKFIQNVNRLLIKAFKLHNLNINLYKKITQKIINIFSANQKKLEQYLVFYEYNGPYQRYAYM